jgi:hypothetical protein
MLEEYRCRQEVVRLIKPWPYNKAAVTPVTSVADVGLVSPKL